MEQLEGSVRTYSGTSISRKRASSPHRLLPSVQSERAAQD